MAEQLFNLDNVVWEGQQYLKSGDKSCGKELSIICFEHNFKFEIVILFFWPIN